MDCTKEPLRTLREDALRLNESFTKKFWLYVFQKLCPRLIWSTEHPPTPYSLRRIDIVGQSPAGWPQRRLEIHVFVEAKGARPTPKDIRDVEGQSYTATEEYLQSNPEPAGVWSISVFATSARVWIHQRDNDLLIPFHPLGDYSEREEYVDISRDGQLVRLLMAMDKDPIVSTGIIQQALTKVDNAYKLSRGVQASTYNQDVQSSMPEAGPSSGYTLSYPPYSQNQASGDPSDSTAQNQASDPIGESSSSTQDQYGNLGGASTYSPAQTPYASQNAAIEPDPMDYTGPQEPTGGSGAAPTNSGEPAHQLVEFERERHLRGDKYFFSYASHRRETRIKDTPMTSLKNISIVRTEGSMSDMGSKKSG